MTVKWRTAFNLNIDIIDSEHQKLIGIINKLYENFKLVDKNELVKQLLKELWDYADVHFKREEKCFEKYDYPETDKHKEQHHVFMNKIKEVENDFLNGKINLFDQTFFLNKWFANHILVEDKKYAKYFENNNLQF